MNPNNDSSNWQRNLPVGNRDKVTTLISLFNELGVSENKHSSNPLSEQNRQLLQGLVREKIQQFEEFSRRNDNPSIRLGRGGSVQDGASSSPQDAKLGSQNDEQPSEPRAHAAKPDVKARSGKRSLGDEDREYPPAKRVNISDTDFSPQGIKRKFEGEEESDGSSNKRLRLDIRSLEPLTDTSEPDFEARNGKRRREDEDHEYPTAKKANISDRDFNPQRIKRGLESEDAGDGPPEKRPRLNIRPRQARGQTSAVR